MRRNKTTSLRIVDTNVPITANLSTRPAEIPEELRGCVAACIEAIGRVRDNKTCVIDAGDEIFAEYLNNLDLSGQNGVGNAFVKWVHDNRWGWPEKNRVVINPDGNDSYREFPVHAGLKTFDPSDRKFIAVANAHGEKPVILQATDSKWWGWKDALADAGVAVEFLCPQYVKTHYEKKFSQNAK